MDLEERFFEGTVQLEQLLACGGAGSVWRVLDNAHVPAQVRALKCIYRNSFSEKHVNEELDILRRVSGGPHVVSILRSCEQDDRVLILMELYDTDLGAAIANQHVALARNHAKARRVVPQLITAVRFCHETANVFHRDIKPENIMLRLGQPELDVVLVDFGLATTSRTSSDFGIGTTQYMTPEAFDSAYNDEPSYSCSHSDLWALGVVLYELLTGDTPWRTPSRDDEDFATFQQDPVSFCKGRSSISTPIQQLLPRIFAPDWRDRMSLEDFAFAVEQEVGDMREPTVSDQELDNAEIKCRWTEST
ncbi:kinase-like domain-containing protein [Auriculariales sp. MPI-PUGE-AT-0066]|nr:kinase-like domain-containing protein [Auriculariales sp. MPI-PUGE-AT-0066]